MPINRRHLLFSVVAAFAGAPMSYSHDAEAVSSRFGLHCQQDFQNGWAGSLPYTNERCNRFANQLDNTDPKIFHYNLANKQYYWHETGDQAIGSLEDVDLFFANTHGGITADGNDAGWTMWNTNAWAYASSMRLGDERYTCEIFATYACSTQSNADGRQIERWAPIFDGGLKFALGSHGLLWNGYYTSEVGEQFAINLQQGQSLIGSWFGGLSDWYYDQEISGISTGTTVNDCQTRLNQMTWLNYTDPWQFPALRDLSWIFMCGSYYE